MRGKNLKYRLLIGAAIALFFVFKRCSQREENPYTGRMQTISMNANEEIAIGLQSAPQMAHMNFICWQTLILLTLLRFRVGKFL